MPNSSSEETVYPTPPTEARCYILTPSCWDGESTLEAQSLDVLLRVFPDGFNWGAKTHPEYGWHHPRD